MLNYRKLTDYQTKSASKNGSDSIDSSWNPHSLNVQGKYDFNTAV